MTKLFLFRVPEDKCHMVLPEIEEEDESSHKLSLTSLLLGQLPKTFTLLNLKSRLEQLLD